MSKLISLLTAALLLALMSNPVWARPGGGHGPRGNPAEHMVRALELDEEQAQAVKDIFADAGEQHQALREQQAESGQQAFCDIKSQVDDRLSQVLNEDQLAQWDAIRAEKGPGRGQGRRHRRGPAPEDCQ